ncbi:MAG: DUF3180 domain-containing protein [Mycobacterium sp.]|nr:DUF3180 domain-containing protein [Mycobacterium sp.]
MRVIRIRELVALAVIGAVGGWLAVYLGYHWFPPLTRWSGVWLGLLGLAEAGFGFYVRSKIGAGEIGVGGGRLDPLLVARGVAVAQASAWLGALLLGGWLGILAFLLERRGQLPVADADTPGAAVAAGCALILVVAAMWLQYCCKSPAGTDDPNAPGSPSS